jgi:hypothetical protein
MHGNMNVNFIIILIMQYSMIVTFVSVHVCLCVNKGRLNEQNT